jgi:hypothetical protein
MASPAGMVLAAGAIVAANEAIFVPIEEHKTPLETFNWRLVPATLVLAITVSGLEKLAPAFGKVIGGLTLLAALTISVGNAPTPLENLAKVVSTPASQGKIFGRK